MNPELMVIGLNHATAPVEIRERITFPGDGDGEVTGLLCGVDGVEEAIILSTCNRSEIIATVREPNHAWPALVARVAHIHGLSVEDFQSYLYTRIGAEAVQHVFRVTSSLDSMVVGEPQILGQVKESYRRATRSNSTGPIINRLMHRAFFTAKRVRHETGVGRAAVSIAYVAVELAKKILGELAGKRVLLLGAGEMAELAARHLMRQVDQPVLVINRTYETACRLAGALCGHACPMDRLDEGLIESDVVITSTGSCQPLIRKDQIALVMRKRRYRPMFLIDIAIPRDVAPDVNENDGVYVYNIDDLQSVVDENMGERHQEASRAESIVTEEVAKFMHWLRSLDAAPTIVALKDKLEEIRAAELERVNGKLARLGPEERETVESITRGIINKIAHDPITFLKASGSRSKGKVYLDVTQRLFKLDGLPINHEATSEAATEE